MDTTEERKQYLIDYKKQKLKRVPLEMTFADYSKLQAAAAAAGSSINGYIKTAISEKIQREQSSNVVTNHSQN